MGPKRRILWLQGITCNGNSHSFFNHPDLASILTRFEFLYHPILPSLHTLTQIETHLPDCDILIVEGAYRADFLRIEKKMHELLSHYTPRAQHIIAAGNCASFGGILKEHAPEATRGILFDKEAMSGPLLPYKEKVINLPGCPLHPEWLGSVLEMIDVEQPIETDEFHRPLALYAYTVHNGCLRNEYFEWKVDAEQFGTKEGCLFYDQGCQGPYTKGSCNKILWNGTGSKTRAGSPCVGCTEPSFPKTGLFETLKHMSIPAQVPEGVAKRAYLTLTGVAKSFRIDRLETPLMKKKGDK